MDRDHAGGHSARSRHSASAIIFLLDRDEEARWHLVHSDELWIWSGPGALEVHLGGSGDAPEADPRIVTLGSPAGTEASDASNPVQILVPAGTWQRTFARGDYALATCVVSPEFTFDDWKLAEGSEPPASGPFAYPHATVSHPPPP